ncbi:MAG: ATP-binding cassette domain-containing protein [Rhodobacteraceae bacterium]|nr:ATP-binding cassette domain-containing protein [Paracoccaceae bacterium]
MARAPLLQLSDVSLTFGGDPILDTLSLTVQAGDRAALVGRNGSGKSTLLKVMAGLIEPDKGARTVASGVSVGYLEQDPDLSDYETLGDYAAGEIDPDERYLVEIVAEGLSFDLDRPSSAASGGEKRRAAIARLIAQDPDLMLLDEPTNHLDITAISWLEEALRNTSKSFILISHDRAFLRNLTRATLWVDRGVMRRQEQGFGAFESWRDKIFEEEDVSRHKLDRKIKAEGRWAVEGISARRKRNMGRVRALKDLRAERSNMIRRKGTAGLKLDGGQASGRKVIEAKNISINLGGKQLLTDFSLTVQRGDRIALVGPNGVGKTTLVRLLLGELEPDTGTIKHGSKLETAYFDQSRSALRLDLSLWENLTSDPDMASPGRSDQVMVRGNPRHVVGYLKEFLFDDYQARAPVRSLSGGEKARLLLARIMARQSNFLVLDEPTNDLDVETLDLLQDVLGEYEGTVILVSHDRDFIDRVADTTIAMEGDGTAVVYAGGWTDYQTQRGRDAAEKKKQAKASPRKAEPAPSKAAKSGGLSFTQTHRLEELPKLISRLEAEIAKLEQLMADPDLFGKQPVKFAKANEALVARQTALIEAEEEWLGLAEKAGG